MFRSLSVAVALLAFAVVTAAPTHAYTIVRKDGARFDAQGPPSYKDGQAVFTLAGGSTGSMPESAIDKPATEKANQPASSPKGATKRDVVTNESLSPGGAAPGGKSKSTFTNDDLKKAEGRSVVEGDVQTGAIEDTTTDDDWAAKHDEEMARLDAERRVRRGEAPPPAAAAPPAAEGEEGERSAAESERATAAADGAAPPTEAGAAPPAPPAKEEDPVAVLQKKVDELRTRLDQLDRTISGGGGNAVTVNERLQTANELTQAEEELANAR